MVLNSFKTLNLALQGGGSHGAFTWGVLDRFLDEDRLTIEGISGTSAGAMNGAALLQGHCKGGNKGAKDSLEKFWRGVGELAAFGLPQRGALDQLLGNWNIDFSPGALMTDTLQRMFSPYQTNPLNFNPLRELLDTMIDIESIRACAAIKLFICATDVETGRARIFTREELTVDALLASGCLPLTFQAVEIGGKPYWDGGYVGNPAIFPLIYGCDSPDVAVVQINPLFRSGTPETPAEIVNRLNEISFNAALIGEIRAIAFVQRLIEEDHLKNEEAARLKRMNMHVIGAEEEMRKLGAASKLNAGMDFLLHLKEIGRKAADEWLKKNWDSIGVESSVDIHKMFLE
jgi:NTE family protein